MHARDYRLYYTHFILYFFSGPLDELGRHPAMREQSKLFAKILKKYMLMTNEEWDCVKKDKHEVEQLRATLKQIGWNKIMIDFLKFP